MARLELCRIIEGCAGAGRRLASARRCQVGDDGDTEGLWLVMASHGGRNAGHISTYAECGVTKGAVFSGGQEVTAKLEVVVDPAVGGKDALRVTG